MDRSGLVSIELLQVLKICNYSWRSKFSLACRGSCFFASLLFLCRRQERPWVSSLDGMNRVGCLAAAGSWLESWCFSQKLLGQSLRLFLKPLFEDLFLAGSCFCRDLNERRCCYSRTKLLKQEERIPMVSANR